MVRNLIKRLQKNLMTQTELEDEAEQINSFRSFQQTEFDEEYANSLIKDGLGILKIFSESNLNQNDYAPEEWVRRCRRDEGGRPFDARCPSFINNRYQWVKVRVLAYDREQSKFEVEVIDTGQIKYVSRHALLFVEENSKIFVQILLQEQHRSGQIRDYYKFTEYIAQMPDDVVGPMDERLKDNIFNRLGKDLGLNSISEEAFGKIQKEVEDHYLFRMKTFFTVKDMENEERQGFYKEKQIRLRYYLPPIYPKYGNTIGISKYKLITHLVRQHLTQHFIFFKRKPQQVLIQIMKQLKYFNKQNVINDQLTEKVLPLGLEAFMAQEKQFISKQKQFLLHTVREHILSEISDILSNNYNFYELRPQNYLNSDTKKLLKRIEYQIQSILQQDMLHKSSKAYLDFLRQFSIPLPNQNACLTDSSDIWIINQK